MAYININDRFNIFGKITAKNVEEVKDGKTTIQGYGTLATHYYIRDISRIKTDRMIMNNVDVYEEVFGSDDFDIIYNFRCDEIEIEEGSIFPQDFIDDVHSRTYGELGFAKDSEIEKDLSEFYKKLNEGANDK